MPLLSALNEATSRKASDLHISAGLAPWLRIDGDIAPLQAEPFTPELAEREILKLMSDEQQQRYKESFSCSFTIDVEPFGRFRVNAYRQHRGAAAAFRPIASHIPTLDDLLAPSQIARIATASRGLVLVTGITGSGKSTTLAAMVDHLNRHHKKHVITVENPIEFLHASDTSLINQREIGVHALSFEQALSDALREDPDVIVVGEMLDLATIRVALTAAETGHLVFATLHTMSGPKTIDRIIDVFPENEKATVRTMLSESLHAVVAQTLVKRKDGNGRIAAQEIMLGTPAIRNLIREGKTNQMHNVIQTGSGEGMRTMDQCLKERIREGLITTETARLAAHDSASFA